MEGIDLLRILSKMVAEKYFLLCFRSLIIKIINLMLGYLIYKIIFGDLKYLFNFITVLMNLQSPTTLLSSIQTMRDKLRSDKLMLQDIKK